METNIFSPCNYLAEYMRHYSSLSFKDIVRAIGLNDNSYIFYCLTRYKSYNAVSNILRTNKTSQLRVISMLTSVNHIKALLSDISQ